MAAIIVPESGLTLCPRQGSRSRDALDAKLANKDPFFMRINLTERFVKDLITGKPSASLTLTTGKILTLGIGSQTQFEVVPIQETIRQELYKQTQKDSTTLQPLGHSAYKLEVLEVEDKAEAESDANLVLALKSQYEALGQHKKERSAVLVDDLRALPPALSGKRGMQARKRAGQNSAFLKAEQKGSLTTQSMPNSPAINPLNSPRLNGITSAPANHQTIKKDPIYIPLIHLLALGSDTDKRLAMKTHTTLKRCSDALIFMGNRTRMGNHWELADPNYKDLDVWRFPYPSDADRELAIVNAAKAFDRLGLARDAPERELLRKPEDRGKPLPEPEPIIPKPVQATPRISTPSIKVTGADVADKEEYRQIPTSEPLSRSSSSQPLPKPKKVSEKEAISKIILNGKNTMKGKPRAAVKAAKEPSETAKVRKLSASKASGKPVKKVNKEYKSAEIITDSDSDMEDVVDISHNQKLETPSHPAVTKTVANIQHASPLSKVTTIRSPKASEEKPSAAKAATSSLAQELKTTAAQSTPSVARKTPATNDAYGSTNHSPNKKPSPLGSSPPINASDLKSRYRSSSSSTTSSLSSIGSENEMSTPTPSSAYTSAPPKQTKTITSKEAAKPRYMPTPESNTAVPQKRKAAPEENRSVPARKTVKTSAAPVDAGDRVAKKKPVSSSVSATQASDIKVKQTTPEVGNASPRKRKAQPSDANDYQKPKAVKSSYASSVTSSTSNSTGSDMSRTMSYDRSYRDAINLDEKTILLAKRFRDTYTKYERLYKEVARAGKPPREKLDAVLNLHKKLQRMKAQINASMA